MNSGRISLVAAFAFILAGCTGPEPDSGRDTDLAPSAPSEPETQPRASLPNVPTERLRESTTEDDCGHTDNPDHLQVVSDSLENWTTTFPTTTFWLTGTIQNVGDQIVDFAIVSLRLRDGEGKQVGDEGSWRPGDGLHEDEDIAPHFLEPLQVAAFLIDIDLNADDIRLLDSWTICVSEWVAGDVVWSEPPKKSGTAQEFVEAYVVGSVGVATSVIESTRQTRLCGYAYVTVWDSQGKVVGLNSMAIALIGPTRVTYDIPFLLLREDAKPSSVSVTYWLLEDMWCS